MGCLGLYASLSPHTPRAHKGEGRATLYSCLCFELRGDTARGSESEQYFFPSKSEYVHRRDQKAGRRMRSVRRRDMPTCFVFRVSCVKNSLPWLNAVLRVEEIRHLHAAHGGQRLAS